MLPRSNTKGLLLVVAAALLTFATALHGSFVNWDDPWLILTNPHLRGFHHLPTILDPTAYRVLMGAEYLPLRDVSNLVDFHFFALEPTGYRLGSWLLYALSAAAAFAFLLEALRSRRAALAGALLWAVHPLHAEVVAWASARKDVLNAVFALLAATLLLRAVRTGRRSTYALALVAFVLATLSKTSAAAMPVALGIWLVLRGDQDVPWHRRAGRAALTVLPFLVIAAAGALVNQLHQTQGFIRLEWRGGGWIPNAFLMCGIYLRYVRQMVMPFGLAADYAVDRTAFDDPWNLVGLFVLLLTLVAPVVVARRHPPVAAGLLWWLVLLFPVANLLVPLNNMSADRYLYLPSLGLCALGGLAMDAFARRGSRAQRVAEWATVATVVVFGILGARQAVTWSDGTHLWTHAVEVSPRCGRAWQNLGEALHYESQGRELESLRLAKRGEEAEAAQRHLEAVALADRALEAYRTMVEVEPWNAVYWMQAGNRLWEIGGPERMAEVEDILRTAVERALPDQGGPHVALAWLVNQKGTAEGRQEAVDLLHKAVERQPELAEAHFNLALWHMQQRRPRRAEEHFLEALRLHMQLADEVRIHDALLALYTAEGNEEAAREQREERERKRALQRGE